MNSKNYDKRNTIQSVTVTPPRTDFQFITGWHIHTDKGNDIDSKKNKKNLKSK